MSVALPDTEIATTLAELAKLKAARDRAGNACDRILDILDAQGFGRRAVEKALDLIDSDAKGSYDELLQVQSLLQSLRAPVQIELPSLYETPVADEDILTALRDEGYWSRVCGSERIYKANNEAQRQAWMEGWDEANQALAVTES